ncbi:MAG TPA: 2-phospho-L-lactate guanylyltransferase [Actinotalea sp.]|nr:2-phospho-L-lactate guanylyltransferase [Actinotalea sp.]
MTGWTVVVPVKRLEDAKSRLDLAGTDRERSEVALALALDTIHAALVAPRVTGVVIVTGEPRVRDAVGSHPLVHLVADPGAGLNAALTAGIRVAGGLAGRVADGGADRTSGVAVLLGDLPALTGADLGAALLLAAEHPLALVADADGTGTTLLTARAGEALVPRFGPGSRAAHEAAGHHLVAGSPGLRRDVDTAADLRVAARLGVGRATAAVLRRPPVYCRLDGR